TAIWHDFLPTFSITDGLAGMGSNDFKDGFVIDEVGRTTLLQYNRDGGVTWKEEPNGTVTEITRTSAGLPEQVTVRSPGDLRIVEQTSYEYDSSDNLLSVTYLDGTEFSWTYDVNFSQISSTTDELGRQTIYEINSTTGNVDEVRVVVGLPDIS